VALAQCRVYRRGHLVVLQNGARIWSVILNEVLLIFLVLVSVIVRVCRNAFVSDRARRFGQATAMALLVVF